MKKILFDKIPKGAIPKYSLSEENQKRSKIWFPPCDKEINYYHLYYNSGILGFFQWIMEKPNAIPAKRKTINWDKKPFWYNYNNYGVFNSTNSPKTLEIGMLEWSCDQEYDTTNSTPEDYKKQLKTLQDLMKEPLKYVEEEATVIIATRDGGNLIEIPSLSDSSSKWHLSAISIFGLAKVIEPFENSNLSEDGYGFTKLLYMSVDEFVDSNKSLALEAINKKVPLHYLYK